MVINNRKDRLDKHELNGEMIVWMAREGEVPHPHTGHAMPPRLPDGTVPKDGADGDRTRILAEWITSKRNPHFARVMANRIWYHLMGQGLVDPVDDFRSSNPASNESLLDALASDLAKHDFSQKHLIRFIMNSQAYQLSARPTATNEEDDKNYSHVVPRLLTAEQLWDAIAQVTEVPSKFPGLPEGTRAVQIPGVVAAPGFLKTFGRPDRLLACECERQQTTTLGQAFQMITSETIVEKVKESPRIRHLLEKKATSEQIVIELFLAALSRYPTEREKELITARIDQSANRRQAVEDLLWAVMNTKEFLLRR
jgi:hypothetical protein